MDDALRAQAEILLESAPASVEMPAGAGKTHLLASAVAVAAERGHRSLVLTHTNAGVDAIRRRLKAFGVPSGMARVETITSWAFSLVRAYPTLADVVVSDTPDWSESEHYVGGASRAARASAVAEVHSLSFEYVFVDEYQDCTVTHHELVLAIASAVPKTIVLGDRLQAIFGFAGVLADWESDVLPRFPEFEIDVSPQRWRGHNEPLGDWLLELRAELQDGCTVDFGAFSIPGLQWSGDTSVAALAAAAHSHRDFDETVVLLDKWPRTVARHASRLGGSYSVMEDINGNFMREQIGGNAARGIPGIPLEGDPDLALWLARFTKACTIGYADLDATVLGRLERNQSLSGLARAEIQPAVEALERLRVTPTYAELGLVAQELSAVSAIKIYRWEAWNDTLQAIRMSAENAETPLENLGRVRERLRRQGRRSHARIASRTLLVKGLEYDHVIIADLSQFTDPRNLYVALSRARKTITIIGARSAIDLKVETFDHS